MRMHRKLATLVKDAPLILSGETDPTTLPSECSLILRGKMELPSGAIKAGDAAFDKLYVNYEKEPCMVKVQNKGKHTVTIIFYSVNILEWLKCDVPNEYPLHTDIEKLPSSRRAPSKETIRKRNLEKAKGLLKGKEPKLAPVVEPENGKFVFKGKLGSRNVLMDIGNGTVICDVIAGTPMKEAAKKAGRELVQQDKASSYAVFVFTDAWRQARATAK